MDASGVDARARRQRARSTTRPTTTTTASSRRAAPRPAARSSSTSTATSARTTTGRDRRIGSRAVVDRYAPVGVSHYLAAEDDGWLAVDEGHAFLAVAEEAGCRPSNLAARPGMATCDRRCRASPSRSHRSCSTISAVVMLHPTGLEAGAPAGRRRRGPAQPRRQGLRLGLRHRPALGLPVRRPARRRPPFHEAWGPDRLAWGSDWPSLLPHHSYRQGRELLTRARRPSSPPRRSTRSWAAPWPGCSALPVGVPA